MGKYRVEIKQSAAKELRKISSKDLKKILTKINTLSNNPRPLGCRKLSADEKYRLRYRPYRIPYSIKDNILVVYVVKVGLRKRIYH